MSVFVFFDIGKTLMDRPFPSPPRQLSERLGVLELKEKISNILFSYPFENPEDASKEIARKLNLDQSRVFEEIQDIWLEQEKGGCALEGGKEILKDLIKHNVPIGIISNIWKPYWNAFSKIYKEFIPHFKVKILSFQVRCKKPNLEIFKKAIKEAQRYGDFVFFMVGDSLEKDILPAKKLGMKTVWISYNSPSTQNIPDIVISHPSQLKIDHFLPIV